MVCTAYIASVHHHANGFLHRRATFDSFCSSKRKQIAYSRRRLNPISCASGSPDSESIQAPERGEEKQLASNSQLDEILTGTMLAGEPLEQVYLSSRDGFSNETFFDKLLPLGGVPSIVIGRTDTGVIFGGYTSYGFYARDDYRESTTPRSMFVFKIDDDQIFIAENTDPVQYDFYDYAIRFGAALLGIPMNPAKHILKSNVGTSSCRLPNGETSVFGDATLSKIDVLQVFCAEKYAIEARREESKKPFGGFLSGLFGR